MGCWEKQGASCVSQPASCCFPVVRRRAGRLLPSTGSSIRFTTRFQPLNAPWHTNLCTGFAFNCFGARLDGKNINKWKRQLKEGGLFFLLHLFFSLIGAFWMLYWNERMVFWLKSWSGTLLLALAPGSHRLHSRWVRTAFPKVSSFNLDSEISSRIWLSIYVGLNYLSGNPDEKYLYSSCCLCSCLEAIWRELKGSWRLLNALLIDAWSHMDSIFYNPSDTSMSKEWVLLTPAWLAERCWGCARTSPRGSCFPPLPGHGVRLWAVVNLDGPTLKQQILSS